MAKAGEGLTRLALPQRAAQRGVRMRAAHGPLERQADHSAAQALREPGSSDELESAEPMAR